ncbi:MAG: four helix bundle protein [Tenericutes bacterium HGW-Tenericutes-6]|nr:MAG: four helix bundle protein [Tenericutes bacterium HGW-Tenericutes-6]
MNERKGAILRQSFGFAVRIVNLYKYLVAEKREFVLSKQLLRSGTAVGALVREAQNAESKADFIHKLGIAQKECDESIYWLELLVETAFLKTEEFESIKSYAEGLLKMIRSAIITTKNKNSSFIPNNS